MSDSAKKNVSAGVPQHLAVIMDGNGRWANKRGLPRVFGHRAGLKALKEFIKAVLETDGIKVLTLFAFSCENVGRPSTEVSALMQMFAQSIQEELAELHAQQVKLKFIGDHNGLPKFVVDWFHKAEHLTTNNQGLKLNIAINYSGQWHIASEVTAMIAHALEYGSKVNSVADCLQQLDQQLTLGELPVDLLIRTSGEQRLSNFLLWQIAYAEFYFTKCFWPDFNRQELQSALADFSQRQRRFGCLEEEERIQETLSG